MLLRTPGLVELGHAHLQLVQTRLQHAGGLLCLIQLFLQILQTRFIRHGQGVFIGTQALAPHLGLARLLFNAALLRRQHLDLLLHLRDAGALLVGFDLGQTQRVFHVGEELRLLFQLSGQQLGLLFAHQGQLGQAL